MLIFAYNNDRRVCVYIYMGNVNLCKAQVKKLKLELFFWKLCIQHHKSLNIYIFNTKFIVYFLL